MIVGSLLVALRLPGAKTLKDKRRVVRSILDQARRRFHLSSSEVGDLGLSGNATLGFATVSSSAIEAEKALDAALEWIESNPEIVVFDVSRSLDRHD